MRPWRLATTLAAVVLLAGADRLPARDQEGFAEAEAMLRRVLALQKEGKLQEAVRLQEKLVEKVKQVFGPTHLSTASMTNNLAITYTELGQYDRAEPLLERCLKIHEKNLPADHPDAAHSLHSLAMLYQDVRQPEKAKPLYLRSLKIYESKLGKDHPRVALVVHNLAVLYEAEKQHEKAASSTPAAELQSLERSLVRQSPALIKHFKANGYKNVGILKFLVAQGSSKNFSDSVGTLNMLLARRLEVALVLANDPKSLVGVIHNASVVAARTKGANHRTVAGRKILFEPDYPLAWGKDLVKADAFVTGTVLISKDLSKMTISLYAFDRAGNKLEQIGKDFDVRNDSGKLTEMNESFILRGGDEDGKAVAAAVKVKQKEAKHPLATIAPPVNLEILYDGQPIAIEYRDGKAFVPEPREGQKVAFRLRRDSSKARYGVVLKVNGENTIARERQPDLHCRRWIVDAGAEPITIEGYQIDGKTTEKFRVLSRAESKARELDYGEDVGTVSVTVFRARQQEEAVDAGEGREERNARAVAKVALPQKATYDALKKALLEEANEGEFRGLVVPGTRVGSRVRIVTFPVDPTPVLSAAVVYYRHRKVHPGPEADF